MAVEHRVYIAPINRKITIEVSLAGFIVSDFFGMTAKWMINSKIIKAIVKRIKITLMVLYESFKSQKEDTKYLMLEG